MGLLHVQHFNFQTVSAQRAHPVLQSWGIAYYRLALCACKSIALQPAVAGGFYMSRDSSALTLQSIEERNQPSSEDGRVKRTSDFAPRTPSFIRRYHTQHMLLCLIVD